jgi:small-conductance mechanosensitive channel
MQVSWVKSARPYLVRAGIALLFVIGGLVWAGTGLPIAREQEWGDRIPRIGGALVVLVAGVIAVRATSRGIRKTFVEQIGDARGAGLSFLVKMVGYLLVIVSVLGTLGTNPGGLLLGGAITGVVIGIAAQQTLGNLFAGIVLLINRPFTVGEHVVMRSGPLNGEYEGRVTDMTLFYVRMETANGPVLLPNSGVLAASIGPGARAKKEEEKLEEEEAEEKQPSPQSGGVPTGEGSERAGP